MTDVFYGPLPFREVEFHFKRESDGRARVLVVAGGVTRRLRHLSFHSPTGMEFGYAGSGPADCARSLLFEFLGFDVHPSVYQAFKDLAIATIPMGTPGGPPHILSAEQLRAALRRVGERLTLSCLRCLDERMIWVRMKELPCPVCRAVGEPADAPVAGGCAQ